MEDAGFVVSNGGGSIVIFDYGKVLERSTINGRTQKSRSSQRICSSLASDSVYTSAEAENHLCWSISSLCDTPFYSYYTDHVSQELMHSRPGSADQRCVTSWIQDSYLPATGMLILLNLFVARDLPIV